MKISPKKCRVVVDRGESTHTRAGQPTMSKDISEIGGAALTKVEKNYYGNVGVGSNTSNYYKMIANAREEECE